MCKKKYLETVYAHFDDKKHYEKIQTTETQLKKTISTALKNLKLGKIAGTKQKWKIGPARLLPKNKNIEKWRPLVSYYHFIGRPIGRKVARALMTVSKQLKKEWETFELSATSDFICEIKKINESIKQDNIDGIWHMSRFDIKNQFTHLPKKDVKVALHDALTTIRASTGKDTISLCSRDWKGRMDKIGQGKKRDFTVISFTDLEKYACFEMDYPYFQVGNTFYKQQEGLPMGGNLSAVLAIIYSMWCEHKSRKHWGQKLQSNYLFRYRDDILSLELIPDKEEPTNYCKQIQKTLQKIYSSALTVEEEEFHYGKMNFLEYFITTAEGTIILGARNKNIDFWNDSVAPQNIIRLPEIGSTLPHIIIYGSIAGMVININKICNDSRSKFLSLIQLLIELKLKKYPPHIVKRAVATTPNQFKLWKNITHFIFNPKKNVDTVFKPHLDTEFQ
jgi:hypothetical protein